MQFEIPYDVTVSLMLTERCNFECSHCMYCCSPRKPAVYMSDEVLGHVHTLITRLRSQHIHVNVNLIGGEPTLNMTEFGRCLDSMDRYLVEDSDVQLEMTTNGWWLTSTKHIRTFMDCVRRFVRAGNMHVRISNDKYHDAYRPSWLSQADRLERQLAAVWDPYVEGFGLDEPIFIGEVWLCDDCGYESNNYDETCPKCGSPHCNPVEVEYCKPVPAPDADNCWIYVQPKTLYRSVIPVGRGSQLSEGYDRDLQCVISQGAVDSLTFTPDGRFTDMCCRGGYFPVGTVRDDPLELLALTAAAIKDSECGSRLRCDTCKDRLVKWRKNRLRTARKHVRKWVDEAITRRKANQND